MSSQETDEQSGAVGSTQRPDEGPPEPSRADAGKQLDLPTVMEKLAALNGTAARVEVHAAGDGSAPRAILSGAVGALSMDGETASGDPRGLVFVPIGADGSTDPGCRPGIYFDAHSFASAKGAEPLTLALHDETLFVISTQS